MTQMFSTENVYITFENSSKGSDQRCTVNSGVDPPGVDKNLFFLKPYPPGEHEVPGGKLPRGMGGKVGRPHNTQSGGPAMDEVYEQQLYFKRSREDEPCPA